MTVYTSMSRKSEIYASYVNKIDAHNAAIGGEPTIDRFPKLALVDTIRLLPAVHKWDGRTGYLHVDGTVLELRRVLGSACLEQYSVVRYQDEAHFQGYRETMGAHQYFEL